MSRAADARRAFDHAAAHHQPACAGDHRFIDDNPTPDLVADMRRICHECPLLDPCALLALALEPPVGHWAGVQKRPPRPRPGRQKGNR